jgi:hypothetical protein
MLDIDQSKLFYYKFKVETHASQGSTITSKDNHHAAHDGKSTNSTRSNSEHTSLLSLHEILPYNNHSSAGLIMAF